MVRTKVSFLEVGTCPRWAVLVALGAAAMANNIQHDARALVAIDDIQHRVAQAGGNALGALSVSLSWSTPHDLDLRLRVPSGQTIAFDSRHVDGGSLDVDMCAIGPDPGPRPPPTVKKANSWHPCTARPVENIVFPKVVPLGRYAVVVRNYRYHAGPLRSDGDFPPVPEAVRAEPVRFEVLVRAGGGGAEARLLDHLCTAPGKEGPESDVRVYEFVLSEAADGSGVKSRVTYEAGPMGSRCASASSRRRELLPAAGSGARARGPAPGSAGSAESSTDTATSDATSPGQRATAGAGGAGIGIGIGIGGVYEPAELSALPSDTLQGLLRERGYECKACAASKAFLVGALLLLQEQPLSAPPPTLPPTAPTTIPVPPRSQSRVEL